MATRSTTHVLKNSDIVNRPLPGSLLKGEPIVNTAEGILYFSGITTSTIEWTPAGTGTSANFFEVGSNLYDLRLRNQITKYQGQSGAGLVGKFLSGTTSGFILANISSIQGVDRYVTGGTLTVANNTTNNQTTTLSYNISTPGSNTIITQNTFTTGGTYNSSTTSIDFKRNDGVIYSVDLSTIDINDTFVTGGTVTSTGNLNLFRNDGVTVTVPKVTYWTSGSTGTDSIKAINSSGLNSTGIRAVAWGNQTLASGNDSTAWGVQTSATTVGSTSQGNRTLASGQYAHSEGEQTTSSGNYSHSEGQLTLASGNASHAEGLNTTATDLASHAEGRFTTASERAAHAEGNQTTASGRYSHAEGTQTIASNYGSHSEGYRTTASGDYSHAEGSETSATTTGSHSEGYLTTASGLYSHAEGFQSTASGQYSHAEGDGTKALAHGSHAEGYFTTASGFASHAEGKSTTSSGNYSHAQGGLTTSSGLYSFASGYGSEASGHTSFIHSTNSLVTGSRSVVLGGQNITGSANDTVYVPYLNLNYLPTLNISNTEFLTRNTTTGNVERTPLSAVTTLDTFVTGFTYNSSNNTFTISRNQGQSNLTASIGSVSGLTISNLTAGRVVYVGVGGLLKDESGFEYNESSNLLTVGNINVTNSVGTISNIGQGGLVIGSGGSYTTPGIGDLTVHGNLVVSNSWRNA